MADTDSSERRQGRLDHGVQWRNPEHVLSAVTRFDRLTLSLIDDRQRETNHGLGHVIGDADTYTFEDTLNHENYLVVIKTTYTRDPEP